MLRRIANDAGWQRPRSVIVVAVVLALLAGVVAAFVVKRKDEAAPDDSKRTPARVSSAAWKYVPAEAGGSDRVLDTVSVEPGGQVVWGAQIAPGSNAVAAGKAKLAFSGLPAGVTVAAADAPAFLDDRGSVEVGQCSAGGADTVCDLKGPLAAGSDSGAAFRLNVPGGVPLGQTVASVRLVVPDAGESPQTPLTVDVARKVAPAMAVRAVGPAMVQLDKPAERHLRLYNLGGPKKGSWSGVQIADLLARELRTGAQVSGAKWQCAAKQVKACVWMGKAAVGKNVDSLDTFFVPGKDGLANLPADKGAYELAWSTAVGFGKSRKPERVSVGQHLAVMASTGNAAKSPEEELARVRAPHLSVTTTAMSAQRLGGGGSYSISVHNGGGVAATGAQLQISLPPHASIDRYSDTGGWNCDSRGACARPGKIERHASGGSISFTVRSDPGAAARLASRAAGGAAPDYGRVSAKVSWLRQRIVTEPVPGQPEPAPGQARRMRVRAVFGPERDTHEHQVEGEWLPAMSVKAFVANKIVHAASPLGTVLSAKVSGAAGQNYEWSWKQICGNKAACPRNQQVRWVNVHDGRTKEDTVTAEFKPPLRKKTSRLTFRLTIRHGGFAGHDDVSLKLADQVKAARIHADPNLAHSTLTAATIAEANKKVDRTNWSGAKVKALATVRISGAGTEVASPGERVTLEANIVETTDAAKAKFVKATWRAPSDYPNLLDSASYGDNGHTVTFTVPNDAKNTITVSTTVHHASGATTSAADLVKIRGYAAPKAQAARVRAAEAQAQFCALWDMVSLGVPIPIENPGWVWGGALNATGTDCNATAAAINFSNASVTIDAAGLTDLDGSITANGLVVSAGNVSLPGLPPVPFSALSLTAPLVDGGLGAMAGTTGLDLPEFPYVNELPDGFALDGGTLQIIETGGNFTASLSVDATVSKTGGTIGLSGVLKEDSEGDVNLSLQGAGLFSMVTAAGGSTVTFSASGALVLPSTGPGTYGPAQYSLVATFDDAGGLTIVMAKHLELDSAEVIWNTSGLSFSGLGSIALSTTSTTYECKLQVSGEIADMDDWAFGVGAAPATTCSYTIYTNALQTTGIVINNPTGFVTMAAGKLSINLNVDSSSLSGTDYGLLGLTVTGLKVSFSNQCGLENPTACDSSSMLLYLDITGDLTVFNDVIPVYPVVTIDLANLTFEATVPIAAPSGFGPAELGMTGVYLFFTTDAKNSKFFQGNGLATCLNGAVNTGDLVVGFTAQAVFGGATFSVGGVFDVDENAASLQTLGYCVSGYIGAAYTNFDMNVQLIYSNYFIYEGVPAGIFEKSTLIFLAQYTLPESIQKFIGYAVKELTVEIQLAGGNLSSFVLAGSVKTGNIYLYGDSDQSKTSLYINDFFVYYATKSGAPAKPGATKPPPSGDVATPSGFAAQQRMLRAVSPKMEIGFGVSGILHTPSGGSGDSAVAAANVPVAVSIGLGTNDTSGGYLALNGSMGDSSQIPDAFGVAGLTLISLGFSAHFAWDLVGSSLAVWASAILPERWAKWIALDRSAPVTVGFSIGLGSTCFVFAIGSSGSDAPIVLNWHKIVEARYLELLISPTGGCQIPGVSTSDNFMLNINGYVLGVGVQIFGEVSMTMPTPAAKLQAHVAHFSLAGMDFKGATLTFELVGIEGLLKIGFSGGLNLWGILDVSVSGGFEVALGLGGSTIAFWLTTDEKWDLFSFIKTEEKMSVAISIGGTDDGGGSWGVQELDFENKGTLQVWQYDDTWLIEAGIELDFDYFDGAVQVLYAGIYVEINWPELGQTKASVTVTYKAGDADITVAAQANGVLGDIVAGVELAYDLLVDPVGTIEDALHGHLAAQTRVEFQFSASFMQSHDERPPPPAIMTMPVDSNPDQWSYSSQMWLEQQGSKLGTGTLDPSLLTSYATGGSGTELWQGAFPFGYSRGQDQVSIASTIGTMIVGSSGEAGGTETINGVEHPVNRVEIATVATLPPSALSQAAVTAKEEATGLAAQASCLTTNMVSFNVELPNLNMQDWNTMAWVMMEVNWRVYLATVREVYTMLQAGAKIDTTSPYGVDLSSITAADWASVPITCGYDGWDSFPTLNQVLADAGGDPTELAPQLGYPTGTTDNSWALQPGWGIGWQQVDTSGTPQVGDAIPGSDADVQSLVLGPGQTLSVNQQVKSSTQQSSVTLLANQGLQFTGVDKASWSSGVSGGVAASAKLSDYGQLTVLDAKGNTLFSTPNPNQAGAKLVIINDTQLAIVTGDGTQVLWDDGHQISPLGDGGGDKGVITPTKPLRSPTGKSWVTLTPDGNLVFCAGSTPAPVWASNWAPMIAAIAAAQTDLAQGTTPQVEFPDLCGDQGVQSDSDSDVSAVIYDGNLSVNSEGGTPSYLSGTAGHAGATASIVNDSAFVITDSDGTALWVNGWTMANGQPVLSGGPPGTPVLRPGLPLTSPDGLTWAEVNWYWGASAGAGPEFGAAPEMRVYSGGRLSPQLVWNSSQNSAPGNAAPPPESQPAGAFDLWAQMDASGSLHLDELDSLGGVVSATGQVELVFSSMTAGHPGATAQVVSGVGLAVYAADGQTQLWVNGTSTPANATLAPGTTLNQNEFVGVSVYEAQNGGFTLDPTQATSNTPVSTTYLTLRGGVLQLNNVNADASNVGQMFQSEPANGDLSATSVLVDPGGFLKTVNDAGHVTWQHNLANADAGRNADQGLPGPFPTVPGSSVTISSPYDLAVLNPAGTMLWRNGDSTYWQVGPALEIDRRIVATYQATSVNPNDLVAQLPACSVLSIGSSGGLQYTRGTAGQNSCDDNTTVWTSPGGGMAAQLTADGQLGVLNEAGIPTWTSPASAGANAFAQIVDGTSFTVSPGDGQTPVWANGYELDASGRTIWPVNVPLEQGQQILSADGQTSIQNSGTKVDCSAFGAGVGILGVYTTSINPITGSQTKPEQVFCADTDGVVSADSYQMDADGNLEGTNADGTVIWSSYSDFAADQNYARVGDGSLEVVRADGTVVWRNGLNVATNLTLSAGGPTLGSGQTMAAGNSAYLTMRADGNLVLSYQYGGVSGPSIGEVNPLGSVVWESGTSGNPGAFAGMGADGNLYVQSGDARLWSSDTGVPSGKASANVATLAATASSNAPANAGNVPTLTIRNGAGQILWINGGTVSSLTAGQTMSAGQSMWTPDGSGAMFVEPDGNAWFSPQVISQQCAGPASTQCLAAQYVSGSAEYALSVHDDSAFTAESGGADSEAWWKTNITVPDGVNPADIVLAMQADGNLILTSSTGAAGSAILWQSGTSGFPGAWFSLDPATGQPIITAPMGSGAPVVVWRNGTLIVQPPALGVSAGGTITSADGMTKMFIDNGNLTIQQQAVQQPGGPATNELVWNTTWTSNTAGSGGLTTEMRAGDYVLLDGDGSTIWTTNVPGASEMAGGTVASLADGALLITAVGDLQVPGHDDGVTLFNSRNDAGQILPAAPTQVTATAGANSATVSVTPPTWVGPGIAEGFVIEATPGGNQCWTGSSTVTSCTITGLTGGTQYTFAAASVSPAVGTSSWSKPSDAVTPWPAPNPPANLVVFPDDGQAVAYWQAPQPVEYAPVTSFTITATPTSGGSVSSCSVIAGSGPLNCTITGLTNGTQYAFTGTSITYEPARGDVSSGTSATGPLLINSGLGAPGLPTGVTAQSGASDATVSWTAPTYAAPPNPDGSLPGLSYQVMASPDGAECTTSTGTSCVVTGLSPGSDYTFQAQVIIPGGGGVGYSQPSSPTAAAGAPAAPTNVTAAQPVAVYGGPDVDQQGDVGAVVTWTPPAVWGTSPITGYTVTASPSGTQCTAGAGTGMDPVSCTLVAAGPRGSVQTFTVVATNAVGTGPASASASLTLPAGPPPVLSGLAVAAGDGQVTAWWGPPSPDPSAPATSYSVAAFLPGGTVEENSVGSCTTTDALTCTITGLSNGQQYDIAAVAMNGQLWGETALQTSVTPASGATPSSTPTNLQVGLAANHLDVEASWTAPQVVSPGPLSYTVTASPGGATCTASNNATSCTVTGLTPGTAYQFAVALQLGSAAGPATPQSPTLVPFIAPGPPTSVTATLQSGAAAIDVAWSAPTELGTPATQFYVATATPGGATCSTEFSPGAMSCTISGLTAGTDYSISVKASNAQGLGPAASATSNVLTSSGAPAVPSGLTVFPGAGQALAVWDAPPAVADAPISGYEVTATSVAGTGEVGGATVGSCATDGATNCAITGLENGQQFQFSVVALSGPAQSAATALTPPVAITSELGVPAVPTAVSTTPDNGNVVVSWIAPAAPVGAGDTPGYSVSATPVTPAPGNALGCTTTGATSCSVGGLVPNTAYTFTVTTTLGGFSGPASQATAPALGYPPPAAPTNVQAAVNGSGSVGVSWSPPELATGSPVTSVRVIASPGGAQCETLSGTDPGCTVSGLWPGTAYTFTATAWSAGGASHASASTVPIVVAGAAPGTPTAVGAFMANGQAKVFWTAPLPVGDAPVTGYLVQALPVNPAGGEEGVNPASCQATGETTCTLTGLVDEVPYTLTVQALSQQYGGVASTPVAMTIPGLENGGSEPVEVPGPVTATAGSEQATVSWTAPNSTLPASSLNYLVTASPGGATCAASGTTSCTVTGLTASTAYTFSVVVVLPAGNGPAATLQNPVTVFQAPSAPMFVTAAWGGDGTELTVNWAASVRAGSSPITGYTATVPGTDAICRATPPATSCVITGLSANTQYTVSVSAYNSSAPSDPSFPAVPVGRPAAPTGIQVTMNAGGTAADVAWTASPTSPSARITGYTVNAAPDGPACQADAAATSCTVTGLTAGTEYAFTVATANALGLGAPSRPVLPLASPTIVGATASNGQVTVSWVPPSGTGGAPVSGYTVTASPGGATCATDGATSCAVSGLTNGTAYTFTVTATAGTATSAASAPSSATTPYTAPDAPSGLSANGGPSQVTLSWQAPASNGGAPITVYAVTAYGGAASAALPNVGCTASSQTTCTVGGLTNGTQYNFRVTASNGTVSPLSDWSGWATPLNTPGAPRDVAASPGSGAASVTWSRPRSDGGSPVTGYVATASPGGQNCSVGAGLSQCSIAGLTDGTTYTVTVAAFNLAGTGPASSSSNPVTPVALAGAPQAVTTQFAGGGTAVAVSWTPPDPSIQPTPTGYLVTALPGGQQCKTPGTTCNVTGLMPGVTYSIFVASMVGSAIGTAADPVGPVTAYSPPNSPTAVSAQLVTGPNAVEVSWTPPRDLGTPAATYYVATASPGGATCSTEGSPNATSCVVSGLTPGRSFTFSVQAASSAVLGGPSVASNAVTTSSPSASPGTPTGVVAFPGNGQIMAMWQPPAAMAGAPITGYTATAQPSPDSGPIPDGVGPVSCTTTGATQCVFDGLLNGMQYSVSVAAISGQASSAWTTGTPAVAVSSDLGVAGAPTAVSGQATAAGSVAVSWTEVASSPDPSEWAYVATASPGGRQCGPTTSTTCTISGLTPGTQYTFTVAAVLGALTLPTSSPSQPVNPVAPVEVLPGIPTDLVVFPGDGQALAYWAAPAAVRNATVTGYTVTANPYPAGSGGTQSVEPITCTTTGATTCSLPGLTNGQQYTFTVQAAAGTNLGAVSPAMPPLWIYQGLAGLPPGVPTAVQAVAGDGQATVSWRAPQSTAGTNSLDYVVTANPGGATCSAAAQVSCAITGLASGTDYTFTVAAMIGGSAGPASDAAGPINPTVVPAAPIDVRAAPGPGEASVSWAPPPSDGGAPITGYTVTASPGGATCTAAVDDTNCVVTGLPATTGTGTNPPLASYTFTVSASNGVGVGPASAESNPVAAAIAPSAPLTPIALGGNGSASVTWLAPLWTGGLPIAAYVVSASPGGQTCSTTGAIGCTITGLTASGAQTFTVTAVNAIGAGPVSAPSNPVTTVSAPGAPTAVSATVEDGQALVSWAAPRSDGGSAITGFTVTAQPGGSTCLTEGATSCTIAGLDGDTAYQFQVTATNAIGTGATSTWSAAVTTVARVPAAPTGVIVAPSPSLGSVNVEWAPVSDTGGLPLTGYTVTASPGGAVCTTLQLSCSIGGLQSGGSYSFTVQASNSVGASPACQPSGLITLSQLATSPSAPTSVTSAPGDGQLVVTWVPPPSDGGAAITSYLVRAVSATGVAKDTTVPGNVTTQTITGLANGTEYMVDVWAQNSVGNSEPPASGGPVTPLAPIPAVTAAAAPANPAVLAAGSSLQAGQQLSFNSANGQILVVMQADGNLVQYLVGAGGSQAAVWASNTAGNPGASVTMQTDGNLVVQAATGGDVLWASNTWGNGGAVAAISTFGAFTVATAAANGTLIWDSLATGWSAATQWNGNSTAGCVLQYGTSCQPAA